MGICFLFCWIIFPAQMQLSAPKPTGLSAISGEIWRHGAYGILQPPQPELPPVRRRGRSQASFNLPQYGQDPATLSLVLLLSPSLTHVEEMAFPRKRCESCSRTIVLIRGAAGGQPAPCYRDRILSSLFQGGKQECAQHFNVCSVKKINTGRFFFPSSRHGSLNQETSLRSPTSYMMCYTVNNPIWGRT